MTNVSRAARLIDLAALICIVAGAALCLVSSTRLQELSKLSYRRPSPAEQGSALAAADRARYLAYGGVGMIAIGCMVGVGGAIRHARSKATAEKTMGD